MTVLVKSATAAGAMKASLRRLIAALDADIAPIGLKTLDEQREAGNASRRTVAALLAVLAGLGLLLAAVGLSGVIAYAARRRVREFGIRMALGAAPGDVLRLVFAQGAALVGIGLGGGILLAAGLGRAASAMLFGVTPLDPLTTTAVCAVVVLAAAVALYVPARWATLIDPAITLRSE
jgi:ABC-type antimicrobial peptide transport system permease subunit